MTALQNENHEPTSKVQRVRLAANTLGISERTVYRRLRSGKLEQLPMESRSADIVTSIVSDVRAEVLTQDRIAFHMDKIICQNDMTNDNLAALRQDLANRDAQIRTLLEYQEDLTHTIQKLQEQIFELARLALMQPAKMEEKPAEVPGAIEPHSSRRKGGLVGWLRTLGRSETDR